MKYLIIGPGNIGEGYKDTRHNIGFTVLDAMALASNSSFTDLRYAAVCQLKIQRPPTHSAKTIYIYESER